MLKELQFLFLITQSVLGCNPPTFHNTQVKFNYNTKVQVTGCITPNSLPFFFQHNINDGIEINLIDQNISTINARAVSDFPGKLYIEFNFNHINRVKNGAFTNLPLLRHLDLHKNDIRIVESGSFTTLPSLSYIRLSNNQIESFQPGTFDDLPELSILDLEWNHLTAFNQEWFRETPKLSFITVAHNRIITITKAAFSNLTNVKKLVFTSNQLEYVHEDAFYGLNNLTNLLLGENRLKTLHVNFVALTELAIPMNNLTYIPEKVLHEIQGSIKIFRVFGNPLQCSCLDKIIQWADRLGIENPLLGELHGDTNPVCVVPEADQAECRENINEGEAQELRRIFYGSYIRD